VDDTEYEKKKCGFNSEEYIEKLSIIRDLFENHYVYTIKIKYFNKKTIILLI